jgi:hypothetical protein
MHKILQLEYLKGRDRPLGRTGDRWKFNIRMVLKKVDFEDVDCIHVGQDRDLPQAHEHSNVLPVSINGETFLDDLINCQVLKKDSAALSQNTRSYLEVPQASPANFR